MAPAVRLRSTRLTQLVASYGGRLHAAPDAALGHFCPVDAAGTGDLAPLLAARFLPRAREAAERGATLLIDAALEKDVRAGDLAGWYHPHASWAMARVLAELAAVDATPARLGHDVRIGEHAVLGERVSVGDRVHIGPSCVIGGVGFGWATGPDGDTVRVPHWGGVIIEDDVSIGPLCTIDAGVLAPTVIRRGARLDAHVHVGHNCEIGAGTFIAAQSGFAGSVRVGRGVLVGGQVGVADHVTIGDGARIAAKSGVIGDVPAGATFAGYPAVARGRWLRALALLHRSLDARRDDSRS